MLDEVKDNEVILYLWQNEDTVVIGNNQNPWKECNVENIKHNDVKLARRLSGGGAVYHDIGNLNFTFITRQELYNEKKQLDVILKATKAFGLDAKFSGRNDILVGGKKFSGNAYFWGDISAYHHGTVLVCSDLLKLSQYLNPSKKKIISKGIDSVKSRVVNLSSINGDISIERMKIELFNSFEEVYGEVSKKTEFGEEIIEEKRFEGLYEKYSSWQWIYGESPSFDVSYEDRFSWGEIQIGINLIDGYICRVKIYSDALATSFITKLIKALEGIKYDTECIKEAIMSIKYEEDEMQIFQDIEGMFK